MRIKCIGCNQILHISEFYKHKDGVHGVLARCKKCVKVQRSKNYEYRRTDHKFVQAERNRGMEKYHRLDYKDASREKMQDPMRKLKHRIRCAAHNLLKKKVSSSELLGCSYEEFYKHMESKFASGMNWHNIGEWHIDHIVPLAWCNTEEELFIYSHYSNLQPLWGIDNMIKGDRFIG